MMLKNQYTRRQKLLQTAELARQEAELHAPATDDHDAGAQALSGYIEGFRKILAREMADLDAEKSPEHVEAEAALRAAVEARRRGTACRGHGTGRTCWPGEDFEPVPHRTRHRQSAL